MKKFISIIAIIIGAIWFGYVTTSANNLTQGPVHIVTVKAGDTLWDIAAAASSPEVDIRDVIDATKELNHIKNAGDLRPGMVIKVPTTTKDTFSNHTYVITE